ncbi:MAG: sulfurtransferase [Cuniculiplasma sp.]
MEKSTFIDVDQVSSQKQDIIFYDCRYRLTEPEWGRKQYLDSHIPGAFYMDLNGDLSSPVSENGGRHPLPDLDKFSKKLADTGLGPGKLAICYDDNLSGAARLWFLLNYLGHHDAVILNGGFDAWKSGGKLVSKEIPVPKEKGTFRMNIDQKRIVPMETVKKSIGKAQIIDVREEIRYLGKEEPIDKKAGRIPGAINLPYNELMNGAFLKPKKELEKILGTVDNHAILYCGSGVTSCIPYAVLKMFGKEPLLYLGSFSDWISYEENKVDTGNPS